MSFIIRMCTKLTTIIKLIVGLLSSLVLSGCSELSYYWQASQGQLEIINLRRPIAEVIADENTEPKLKYQLELVEEIQQFATDELKLSAGNEFIYYADLKRPQVTWLVVASARDKFEAYQNCYLIVGCLSYRGFFAREAADKFAAELKQQDYDVYIRPVATYSTLGWFSDPILNTYVYWSKTSLAGLIFHEQAHAQVFAKGDTQFNESFASFVERKGIDLFLGNNPQELENFRLRKADEKNFTELVLSWKNRLEKVYADEELSTEQKLAKKQQLFNDMRADYASRKQELFKVLNYDGWFERDLNNAYIIGFEQYTKWLPAFEQLFESVNGDFMLFYKEAERIKNLEPQQRSEELKKLNAT